MPRQDRQRSRPRRADARIRRKNIVGMLVCALVLIGVAGIAAAYVVWRPPTRDEASGCLIDAPPPSLTVILIDASDPLTPRQNTDVLRRLDELHAATPRDGRVELHALVDKPAAVLLPIFRGCNPGDPKSVNEWFGSKRIAEDLWRSGFDEPFSEALRQSMAVKDTKLSPIMEAVQSIAVTTLGRAEFQQIPRRLVIMSDFIQNVPELNQYAGVAPFEKVVATSYYRRVRSDLRGVDVEMLYLWRTLPKNVQSRSRADFWMSVFGDQGARPTVKSIQG